MKEYKGTVAQVQGPVVDVQFARDEMPAIKDALWLEVGGQKRVMEVACLLYTSSALSPRC